MLDGVLTTAQEQIGYAACDNHPHFHNEALERSVRRRTSIFSYLFISCIAIYFPPKHLKSEQYLRVAMIEVGRGGGSPVLHSHQWRQS